MQYRQGDIMLVKVSEPDNANFVEAKKGEVVLALGEVTGHRHRFTDDSGVIGMITKARAEKSFSKEDGVEIAGSSIDKKWIGEPTDIARVVVPEAGADLVHEEHDTIKVPAGTYEVRRQQEFVAPNVQPRYVAD